jgi:hypothetical protein
MERITGKKAMLGFIVIVVAVIAGLVLMRAHEHGLGNSEGSGGFAPSTPWSSPSAGTSGTGKTPASPLHIGESLSYRVSWSTFATAASATISIPGRLYFFGDSVWDFRAQISTVNPIRQLFTIDDQFISYAAVSTLNSRQYVMRLSELGRNRTQQFRAAPSGGGSDPSFGIIPPATCDPLSALFLLRTSDWTHPVHAPVFDGKQTYEMTAQLLVEESIAVPAGKFSASRIRVDLQGSVEKTAHIALTIWLAQDAYRTPVAVEAALPFGSLRMELTARIPGR